MLIKCKQNVQELTVCSSSNKQEFKSSVLGYLGLERVDSSMVRKLLVFLKFGEDGCHIFQCIAVLLNCIYDKVIQYCTVVVVIMIYNKLKFNTR